VEEKGPVCQFRHCVSRETLERLQKYEELLRKWQQGMNLVSSGSLSKLWTRHFWDSAQLGSLVLTPDSAHVVDVGSGAGFPGMILAILGYGSRVSLVEASAKRCSFLREVARQTDTLVEVVEGRLESPKVRHRLGFPDVVVARACAPLDRLLDLVFPILRPQTYCIFPKGKEFEAELANALASWTFEFEVMPSSTTSEGRILRIDHVAPRM
jgi:16S rRNA (guanine527-N7)-methyltransferase